MLKMEKQVYEWMCVRLKREKEKKDHLFDKVEGESDKGTKGILHTHHTYTR